MPDRAHCDSIDKHVTAHTAVEASCTDNPSSGYQNYANHTVSCITWYPSADKASALSAPICCCPHVTRAEGLRAEGFTACVAYGGAVCM